MLLACSIKIKARKHQDVPCCATVLFLGKRANWQMCEPAKAHIEKSKARWHILEHKLFTMQWTARTARLAQKAIIQPVCVWTEGTLTYFWVVTQHLAEDSLRRNKCCELLHRPGSTTLAYCLVSLPFFPPSTSPKTLAAKNHTFNFPDSSLTEFPS